MKGQIEALTDLLANIDRSLQQIAEHSVQSQVQSLVRKYTEAGEAPLMELLAESMAFAFVEDYPDSPWGTYYGPMFVLPNGQGGMVESPSITAITSEVLSYWKERASEAKHPCLRARYADLVWDFYRPVTGKSPDVKFARIVIDASLDITKRNLHEFDISTVQKLARSMSLSLSINDERRVEAVRDALISFENQIAQDEMPGTWGFSFDLLLTNRKIPIEPGQEKVVVSALESRLNRLHQQATMGAGDIFAAEAAALRLEKYYSSKNDVAEARRVLQAYGELVTRSCDTLEPMVAHHWLQRLFGLLSSRGMQADAAALTDRILTAGERTAQGLHATSHEVKIPQEQIESFYSSFCNGSLSEALGKIAGHFIPDPDSIVEQVKDLALKAPLQSLITHTIIDQHGRPVVTIGSLESDLDGHVINQMSQNLHIHAIFLRGVIERVCTKYHFSPEDILTHLYHSPVYEPDKKPILRVGLSAYLKADYVTAVCVLVPQVEASIRELAKINGAAIYKMGRHGGLMLRTLDDLLRDESIIATLTSRIIKYFTVLFTDQRGWNLRNDVCHGLLPYSLFGSTQADRLFHVLLLLSFMRSREASEGH